MSGGYSPLDPRADAAGDLGDTWQYDPSTRRWTRLPGSAGPSSRRGAVASYDAAAGGLVLYGGTNGQVLLNDTWQLTRGRWTRRSGPCRASDCPPAAPSLLLGAAPGLLLCVATKQGQTTWALQGDTWREISTNSPAARLDAVGFYDPERRLSAIVTGTTVDGRHATTTEVYEPVG